MRKQNFRSLAVNAEYKCGTELHPFGSQGRAEVRKLNFTFLAVTAERKCRRGTLDLWQLKQSGSGTSDIWQSRQSGSVEAEHQILGSQGRVEVWKRNFRSSAVKTEQKCGSRNAGLWQSSQVGRTKAELNIFDRSISYWLTLPVLKNKEMWRSCVAKTHDFHNFRDKVNMLLQQL